MITAHHHIVILAFIIIFFLVVVVPTLPAHAESRRGFSGTMIGRAHTGTTTINFTQAALDSHRRLSFLASRSSPASHPNNDNAETVSLRIDGGGGAYDMEFAIGTPPQKLTALADTGSDLIWAKCGGGGGSPPSSSYYNPSSSSTFTKLPCSDRLCAALRSDSVAWCAAGGAECDYKYSYGLGDDHPYTQGFLGSETFTLGGDAVAGVGFGCTTSSEGEYGDGAGLVGLGRGPLSLVSQLDAGAFMYCLAGDDASKPSPLLFGSLATMAGAGVQSTGLLDSATFYAVNLLAITIGSAPTTAGPDGGVVFDSGTTLTFLAEPAYTAAKAAFISQTTNLTRVEDDSHRDDGFEVCYRKPSGNGGELVSGADVPAMVLHFDGGADMDLPVANYVVEVDDGVVCWVVQRSPSLSIIGNVMQRNYLVLHDVRSSILSFQPANCDTYKANEAVRLASSLYLVVSVLCYASMLLCL